MAIEFTTPRSDEDLKQILKLQEINHVQSLSADSIAKDGFVTVKHSFSLLADMNAAAPQIIAKDGEQVVGYALVMLQSFRDMVPVLVPMFNKLDTLDYNGSRLNAYRYYVIGQICVAEAYRGKGIFEGMYNKHRELYQDKFDLCLTEVASRNTRSIRAHLKVGFRIIHTFTDATDTWDIIAWNWQ